MYKLETAIISPENKIMSVNYKFMEIEPKKLIQIIKESNSISGLEVYVHYNNNFELEYLDLLVKEIKENNYILQIHADTTESIESQIKFLSKISEYSNYLNQNITITCHPIYDLDKEISIIKTKEYMNEIITQINNNNLIFCLENLNNINNQYRLKKEDIYPIIKENNSLFLTYDIGHELIELSDIIFPKDEDINKIRNVHIHDNNQSVDHLPYSENSINRQKITESIQNLLKNNYLGNFVFEYDLLLCNGKSTEDKIRDYLKSIKSL